MFTGPEDLEWRDEIDCYFFTVPSVISFFGCLFVVLSILLMKKLQTVTFKIIAIQMTAEGLYNLTHAYYLYPPKDKTFLCATQGYMQVWTLNVQILLTAFMSYHMYRCITRKSPAAYTLTSKHLYLVAGSVALYAAVAATVPLIRHTYGLVGSQCWLVNRHSLVELTIFNTWLLYGPLWVCVTFSLFSYITIFKYVKKISHGAGTNTTASSATDSDRISSARLTNSPPSVNRSSQQTEAVVWKLMYYPGIMIFCWTGVTALRIHHMAYPGKEEKAIFMWFAHGLEQVQGILDAAVFATYPSVQGEYRLLYEKYFASAVVDNDEMISDEDYREHKSTICLATRPTIITEESNPIENSRPSASNSASQRQSSL